MLRSKVLSRSATRSATLSATHMYHVVKGKFVKHQNVSKYHENNCLQNLLLLFMSLITAPIVKNSHIYARINFVFLKNVLKQT